MLGAAASTRSNRAGLIHAVSRRNLHLNLNYLLIYLCVCVLDPSELLLDQGLRLSRQIRMDSVIARRIFAIDDKGLAGLSVAADGIASVHAHVTSLPGASTVVALKTCCCPGTAAGM